MLLDACRTQRWQFSESWFIAPSMWARGRNPGWPPRGLELSLNSFASLSSILRTSGTVRRREDSCVCPGLPSSSVTFPVGCLKIWPPEADHLTGIVFPSLCSVQTAVINVFKGGGLQSNELYALNESIRYLAGQNQCCFPVRGLRVLPTSHPHSPAWSLSLLCC